MQAAAIRASNVPVTFGDSAIANKDSTRRTNDSLTENGTHHHLQRFNDMYGTRGTQIQTLGFG